MKRYGPSLDQSLHMEAVHFYVILCLLMYFLLNIVKTYVIIWLKS